jgi:hypothetical protein
MEPHPQMPTFQSRLFLEGFQPNETYIQHLRAVLSLGGQGLKDYAAFLLALPTARRVDDRQFLLDRLGVAASATIAAIEQAVAFHLRRFIQSPEPEEIPSEFSDLITAGVISVEEAALLTQFFDALQPLFPRFKTAARLEVYKQRGTRVYRSIGTTCRLVVSFHRDFRAIEYPGYEYDAASDYEGVTPVALVSLTSSLNSVDQTVDFQADKAQLKEIVTSLTLTMKQLEALEEKFGGNQ